MILMGLDPSYTRAGITILNTETKELNFYKLEGRMNKNYDNVWREALDRCKRLSELVVQYNVDIVFSESPFPNADSSPGLYLLDGMLHYTLYLSKVSKVYVVHPSYLKAIHQGKYFKSDSIELGKQLKTLYEKHGYICNKNRIVHDEYESFIFLTRLFVLLNIDSKLISDIIKLNKAFDTLDK